MSSSSDPVFIRGISHILSKTDYKNLNRQLAVANLYPDSTHSIVLYEFVHSGIYDEIAEIQRIPGTTVPVYDFLRRNDVINVLKELFCDRNANMNVGTRRKINFADPGPGGLTKYRQLILYVYPSNIPVVE